MGRENLPEFPYGSEDLLEVQDRLGDPPVGLGRVGRHSLEVRDGSVDNTKGLGRIGEVSRKFGTGRGTLLVVRNTSGTLPEV